MELASDEHARGRDHPGAHPGLKIPPDPFRHRRAAAVALKPGEIKAEPLGTLPQVRVLEAAGIGEQEVMHLPEASLPRGGFGGPRGWPSAGWATCA